MVLFVAFIWRLNDIDNSNTFETLEQIVKLFLFKEFFIGILCVAFAVAVAFVHLIQVISASDS